MFCQHLKSSPATSKFPFRGGFFPCCVLIGYSPGVNGSWYGCCPHLTNLMRIRRLLKPQPFKWLLKHRNRTYLMNGYEPPPDLTCRQLLNFKELYKLCWVCLLNTLSTQQTKYTMTHPRNQEVF